MQVRYATLGLEEPLVEQVAAAIGERGILVLTRAWPAAEVEELDELDVHLIFMADFGDLDSALQVARRMTDASQVVVISEESDPDALRRAMRAGCRGLVKSADLLDRAPAEAVEVATWLKKIQGMGRVVGVLGARGGMGTTTIACALAKLLAGDQERDVCLVDFDSVAGDLTAHLGLESPITAVDILERMDQFDDEKLKGGLARTASRYWVLPLPPESEEPLDLDEKEGVRLLGLLARTYTDVVIDLGSAFDSTGRAAVRLCDDVVLVGNQSLPGLRALIRRRKIVRRLAKERDQVHVVLNRFDKSAKPGLDDVESHLGQAVAATVADDLDAMSKVDFQGGSVATIAPRSRITSDLRRLKARLAGESMPPTRANWWRFGKR